MDSTLVIWHGYLLGATGSNIYTRNLVDSWLRAGHDVVLVCQERDPAMIPWVEEEVDLVLRPDGSAEPGVRRPVPGGGAAGRRELADDADAPADPAVEPGRCTIVRPDIGGLLPVYVYDRYEGFEVVTFTDLDDDRLERYAAAQAAAAAWVVGEFAPSGVLVNHAVPLPAAIGPVLDDAGVPYAVKVHGSELEYAIAPDTRFVPPARVGLAGAASVLVGSGHIAARTAELLGGECLDDRVDVVPPGVDLEHFVPLEGGSRAAAAPQARRAATDRLVAVLRERELLQPGGRGAAARALVAGAVAEAEAAAVAAPDLPHPAPDEPSLAARLAVLQGSYEERHVDDGAADAVASGLDPDGGPVITFVGKLIAQKGVHLLLAALPLVARTHPDVQVLVAGFGPMRDALEAMAVALGTGARHALDELVEGAADAGERAAAMPEVRALLDALAAAPGDELDTYWEAAAGIHERIVWLGLVDHGVLARSWPLCTTSVVPSVLAEAFGMVAAEAAACGAVPVVSDHSGLADAAAVIELGGVAPVRFDTSDPAKVVEQLAQVLAERLSLPPAEASRQALAARANVVATWGWDALAVTVADRMCGRRGAPA